MTPGPRYLYRGLEGADVRTIQVQLNLRTGARLAADGIFGPDTEAAVRTAQRRCQLPATGRVDTTTRQALYIYRRW